MTVKYSLALSAATDCAGVPVGWPRTPAHTQRRAFHRLHPDPRKGPKLVTSNLTLHLTTHVGR